MDKIKKLEIREKKEYTQGSLILSHLSDTGRCHFMTSNHGEVTSASLNLTDVKRVIKWLEKWVKFKSEKPTQIKEEK